jgi:hypothetical protein
MKGYSDLQLFYNFLEKAAGQQGLRLLKNKETFALTWSPD